MSKHEPTSPDEEVEAHLLKEALATGAAAATMLAVPGAAQGATAPTVPEPSGSPSQVIPVPDVGSNAKAAPSRAMVKRHHKIFRHKA
jgi:hypothetical protein